VIDHISIGVTDLERAKDFYTSLLGILGFDVLIEKPGTIGYGKKYPEFWLNHRPGLVVPSSDNGTHICLRARSRAIVDELYSRAIGLGATSSGEPGFRPEYHDAYYACFFKDIDANHIEVVTFVQEST